MASPSPPDATRSDQPDSREQRAPASPSRRRTDCTNRALVPDASLVDATEMRMCTPPHQTPTRAGSADSPDRPEKIELVSDGTSKHADRERHQNHHGVDAVQELLLEPHARAAASAGSRSGNRSKTKMKAFATTGMNEYWMNAFSQFQNSHSSVGTMKNGTNSGPSKRTDGARDHAERHDEQQRELRQADDDQHRPVEQVRQNRPGVRLLERVPEACSGVCCAFCTDRALSDARQVGGLVRDQVRERTTDARESATRSRRSSRSRTR